jgi:hypothetical protein
MITFTHKIGFGFNVFIFIEESLAIPSNDLSILKKWLKQKTILGFE